LGGSRYRCGRQGIQQWLAHVRGPQEGARDMGWSGTEPDESPRVGESRFAEFDHRSAWFGRGGGVQPALDIGDRRLL